jgi:hypothetical protein
MNQPNLKSLDETKGQWWSIDERALGLFRIVFAFLLILDWADRWSFRGEFLSATGLTPPSLNFERLSRYSIQDLFSFTTSAKLVEAYLFFGLTSYIFLIIGYFTRFACACSLLFYSSLILANPALRNFSDSFTVLCLLWCFFADPAVRFSIDSIRLERFTKSCFGHQALFLQITLMILAAGLAKTGATWINGTALYYVLSSPNISSEGGMSFTNWSPLLLSKALCWSSLTIELVCPILLLLPGLPNYLRRFAMILLALLWFGIAVSLSIGIGPWIMFASTIVFLDKKLLDQLWSSESASKSRHICNSYSISIFHLPLAAIAFAMFVNFTLKTRLTNYKMEVPSSFLIPFDLLGATQDWTMFAPDPATTIAWPAVKAELADGRQVEIFTGVSPDFSKITLPQSLPRIKRKYLETLGKDLGAKYRMPLLMALCKNPNLFSELNSKILKLEMFIIKQRLQQKDLLMKIESSRSQIEVQEVASLSCQQIAQ